MSRLCPTPTVWSACGCGPPRVPTERSFTSSARDGRAPIPGRRGTALHCRSVVEILFMMVVLKLPILYLAAVVYWAVKAEPRPYEGALLPVAEERPPPAPSRRPGPRPRRGGPHGSPTRREPRRTRVARASL